MFNISKSWCTKSLQVQSHNVLIPWTNSSPTVISRVSFCFEVDDIESFVKILKKYFAFILSKKVTGQQWLERLREEEREWSIILNIHQVLTKFATWQTFIGSG
jgi:hypothetical protein